MSYVSSYSHCRFRTKDRPRIAQTVPSGLWVLATQSHHSKGGLCSNLPSGRCQSVTSSVTTAHGRRMSKLLALLGSESSSPDTEMIPTRNPNPNLARQETHTAEITIKSMKTALRNWSLIQRQRGGGRARATSGALGNPNTYFAFPSLGVSEFLTPWKSSEGVVEFLR